LFRQLYETLIRVDCGGRVRAGLAESWRPDTSGRSWVLTLRSDARFSDGTPVTSDDVVSGWSRGQNQGQQGQQGELDRRVGRYVESVVPVTDRVLGVTLHRTDPDAVAVLADPDLAVARRVDGSEWPMGSRGYTVHDERGGSTRGAVQLIPVDTTPLGPSPGDGVGGGATEFLVEPGGDPRDLLDRDVDLLVSGDPAVLDYAETLPRFTSLPLAWHRLYLFASPGRDGSLPPLSADLRQALARDAVRGEARGAETELWRDHVSRCGFGVPTELAPRVSDGRVVYERGDAAARDLAERLVALSSDTDTGGASLIAALGAPASRHPFRRSVALDGHSWSAALRSGDAAGYIVSVRRVALDPCRPVEGLLERADWIGATSIVPLVDTRLRAIVRRRRSGLTVDWDGGLLLVIRGSGDSPRAS